MNLNQHIDVATGIVIEEVNDAWLQSGVANPDRIPVVSTRFKNSAAKEICSFLVNNKMPPIELIYGSYDSHEKFQSDVDKAIGVLHTLALSDKITEYGINKLVVGSLNRILSDRTADIRFQYILCICSATFYRAWGRFTHDEY